MRRNTVGELRLDTRNAGDVLLGCLKGIYDTQRANIIELRELGIARAFRPTGPFAVLTARLWHGLQTPGPNSAALRKSYERLVRSRDAPSIEEVGRHLLIAPETPLTLYLSDGTELCCTVGTLPITAHLPDDLEVIRNADEVRIAIAPDQWPEAVAMLLQFIRGWVFASFTVAGIPEAPLRAALDADFPIVVAEDADARA
ncbi:MAG: hypothetical protein V1723_00500 [Candidatus Uhrbacteria bacterium]